MVVRVGDARSRSPIGLGPASTVALVGAKRLPVVEGAVIAERYDRQQNQRQGAERAKRLPQVYLTIIAHNARSTLAQQHVMKLTQLESTAEPTGSLM